MIWTWDKYLRSFTFCNIVLYIFRRLYEKIQFDYILTDWLNFLCHKYIMKYSNKYMTRFVRWQTFMDKTIHIWEANKWACVICNFYKTPLYVQAWLWTNITELCENHCYLQHWLAVTRFLKFPWSNILLITF